MKDVCERTKNTNRGWGVEDRKKNTYRFKRQETIVSGHRILNLSTSNNNT